MIASSKKRRCARVVEWGALEKRYARKGIGGSNPPTSARYEIKKTAIIVQHCVLANLF